MLGCITVFYCFIYSVHKRSVSKSHYRDPQNNGTPVMPTPPKLSKSASVFPSQQENTSQKLSTNSCKKNQPPTAKKVDESDKTGKKEKSGELRKPSNDSDKKNQPSTAKKVDESVKKGQKEESEKLKKQANDLMVIPQDTSSNLQNTVTNDAVYQGYLDREFISTDRIIRIFTSSTFTGKNIL